MRSGHNADGHWNGTVASCCYLFPSSIPSNVQTRVHRLLLVCVRGFTQPLGMAAPCASAKITLLLRWPVVARTFPRGEEGGEGGDDVVAGVVDVGPATASDVAPGGSRSGNSPRLSISPMHTQWATDRRLGVKGRWVYRRRKGVQRQQRHRHRHQQPGQGSRVKKYGNVSPAWIPARARRLFNIYERGI